MNYVTRMRRELHKIPELGFELPKTVAFIKEQLEEIGVEYTEKYGISSIVATINPDKTKFTIGIRADIDGLPIQELNEVEYKSTIDGQMHACGHDAHAAIALATAKRLYEMRDALNCRVKILFQANEEVSCGAKNMVEDGVMEDIDCIVALHCGPELQTGTVRIGVGELNSVSIAFKLKFYGKASHVASQAAGIDAIMMAVRAYTDMQFMISKEIPAAERVIFNVGTIHGGTAKNVIAEYCELLCTLRTWTDARAEKIMGRIRSIISHTAEDMGGRAEMEQIAYYPVVVNDERATKQMVKVAKGLFGEENVLPRPRGMGGEDFAYFAKEKPACMVRLGTGNKEKGITAGVHHADFDVDEDALELGVEMFTRFVIDNQNGLQD